MPRRASPNWRRSGWRRRWRSSGVWVHARTPNGWNRPLGTFRPLQREDLVISPVGLVTRCCTVATSTICAATSMWSDLDSFRAPVLLLATAGTARSWLPRAMTVEVTLLQEAQHD